MYTGDIVIHIDEALDDDRIHDLEHRTDSARFQRTPRTTS